jgi:heme a synthase
VRGELDYGWVMGHFALSMLILVAAVVLVWRAGRSPIGHEPEPEPEQDRPGEQAIRGGAPAGAAYGDPRQSGAATAARSLLDRRLVLAVRTLVGLAALTIVAGTAATAAGPHAGGSPGQKINRMDFDGRGTMDFVIHRHAEIAFVFSLAAVAVWLLARHLAAPRRIRRPLTVLCVLLALQGVVGLDQYETHLPTELVWIHVGLASLTWLSVLWAACAAGRLAPRAEPATEHRARSSPEIRASIDGRSGRLEGNRPN